MFLGDKDRYSFPSDLSTLHAEFTYFYFPGDFDFPGKQQRHYFLLKNSSTRF